MHYLAAAGVGIIGVIAWPAARPTIAIPVVISTTGE
jgi:hypothetical protein